MEGSSGVRKGAWSQIEDNLLRDCVNLHGEGKWHLVPKRAGIYACASICLFSLFVFFTACGLQ